MCAAVWTVCCCVHDVESAFSDVYIYIYLLCPSQFHPVTLPSVGRTRSDFVTAIRVVHSVRRPDCQPADPITVGGRGGSVRSGRFCPVATPGRTLWSGRSSGISLEYYYFFFYFKFIVSSTRRRDARVCTERENTGFSFTSIRVAFLRYYNRRVDDDDIHEKKKRRYLYKRRFAGVIKIRITVRALKTDNTLGVLVPPNEHRGGRRRENAH